MSDRYLNSRTTPYPVNEVVQRNRRIADELRARGGLIVWVRVDLKSFLKLPVDQPPFFAGKQLPAELSEIAPSAGFQEGDLLITKPHWGAFAGTALEQELSVRKIDTVLLTGVSTNAGLNQRCGRGPG
jgi:nicotinamidase-related amidase